MRVLVAAACWLIAAVSLPTAADQPPADVQASTVASLRAAMYEYQRLIAQISPDHLPGQMAGYPEATEGLERLGERLELLSRRAVTLDRQPGDWAPLAADIAAFRDDLGQLRRTATPLRAYSHSIRAGVKRPRWAVSQVPTDDFVTPPVTEFHGNFTRNVSMAAAPGHESSLQLVVVPIQYDIEQAWVRLPDSLRGPGGVLAPLDLTCYLAATRSTPLEPEQRDSPDCPYRLRQLTQPVRLTADLVQPLWIVVQAPPDTRPGSYTGTLLLTGRGVHSLELGFRVTIVEGK